MDWNYFDVTVYLSGSAGSYGRDNKLSTVVKSSSSLSTYMDGISKKLNSERSLIFVGADNLERNIVANCSGVLAVTVEESNYPEKMFPYSASDL